MLMKIPQQTFEPETKERIYLRSAYDNEVIKRSHMRDQYGGLKKKDESVSFVFSVAVDWWVSSAHYDQAADRQHRFSLSNRLDTRSVVTVRYCVIKQILLTSTCPFLS